LYKCTKYVTDDQGCASVHSAVEKALPITKSGRKQ
jgi:hypothetical protein